MWKTYGKTTRSWLILFLLFSLLFCKIVGNAFSLTNWMNEWLVSALHKWENVLLSVYWRVQYSNTSINTIHTSGDSCWQHEATTGPLSRSLGPISKLLRTTNPLTARPLPLLIIQLILRFWHSSCLYLWRGNGPESQPITPSNAELMRYVLRHSRRFKQVYKPSAAQQQASLIFMIC